MLFRSARQGLVDPVQFRDIVQQANTAIYTASLDDTDQRGMGTTVTALTVLPGSVPRVMVANVGDSRTYIFRDGELQPVSIDHSYVQELVNERIITREEARVHPRRNIVTRALGIDRNVSVDVFTQEVRTGDRLLLCSDGLVDEVPDNDIATVLTQFSNPQECAEALVMLANTNGGRDNTTVIVVDVADDISAPVAVVPDNDTTGEVALAAAEVVPQRKKRVTIGMTLFWSVLVAIVLGVVAVLGVYGRTGYFIGFTENDTVVVVPVASTICEATVRRHTRSYSRSAFVPSPFAVRREKSTGRIASWASWALRTLLLIGRAFAGTLSVPNIDTAALRAATIACGDMCGLSVRG